MDETSPDFGLKLLTDVLHVTVSDVRPFPDTFTPWIMFVQDIQGSSGPVTLSLRVSCSILRLE